MHFSLPLECALRLLLVSHWSASASALEGMPWELLLHGALRAQSRAYRDEMCALVWRMSPPCDLVWSA